MKLLVISDIHGNWAALQAVLKAEPNVDRILCLGDLVDYGPEPVACVGWALRQQGSNTILVQGNHDWGVAEKKDPRASPLYRELAAVTQTYCLTVLSPKMQTFLRSLPSCCLLSSRREPLLCVPRDTERTPVSLYAWIRQGTAE